jgi:site-specific recombinase XerD
MPQLRGDLTDLARSFERELRARNLSPSTIRIYTLSVAALAAFLGERGMPTVVANLTREHVEEWLIDLGQRSAPATVETRFRGAKAFFDFLVAEGEIKDSPMARIKRSQVPDAPPPIVPEEQLQALLKTADGKEFDSRRDSAILRLLIDTGMRRSECAYLGVDDLDLDQNVAYVVGKGNRPRVAPFGRKTAVALDRYLRLRRAHRHAESDRLWLGRQGPLNDSAVDLMIRRRARQAGIEQLHAHLFRHTFAHRWLADGGQEGDLMVLAGWKSREMVGRYGRSAAAERAREAYRNGRSPGDRL